MKRILFLTCMLLVFAIELGYSQNPKRKALLIGNSKYIYYSPLSNSIRDVDSMAVALKVLGFNVTVKKNTEYRTMTAAVNSFVQNLEADDIALLYYSGHGIGFNGNNYMLPIEEEFDCLNQLEELIPISLNRIVKNIENKGVKNSFVFLDACRNLPRFKNCDNSKSITENTQGFVIPSSNPKGNLIFFATREGSTANDDTFDKTNSLFTSELLKYIRIPDISIRTIVDKVINGVEQRSNYKQIPQKLEDLRGDFYFLKTSDEEKARIVSQKQLAEKDSLEKLLKLQYNEKLKEELLRIEKEKVSEVTTKNVNSKKKDNSVSTKQDINNSQESNKLDFVKNFYDLQTTVGNLNKDSLNLLLDIELKKIEAAKETELKGFLSKIILGEEFYKLGYYSKANDNFSRVQKEFGECLRCQPYLIKIDSVKNILKHNVDVVHYKKWKTTNKVLLGTSLACISLFSIYNLDYYLSKKDLNNKQKKIDPDGDNFVYMSNIASNNIDYVNYQTAYNKLARIQEKNAISNGFLIGGAVLGTSYLVKKIIRKKKPNNLQIIPFKNGLSLSISI